MSDPPVLTSIFWPKSWERHLQRADGKADSRGLSPVWKPREGDRTGWFSRDGGMRPESWAPHGAPGPVGLPRGVLRTFASHRRGLCLGSQAAGEEDKRASRNKDSKPEPQVSG